MAKERLGGDWAAELVRRVGLAVKKARGGRPATWLSDRTEAIGYRISPTVIAKLDSGHRGDVLSVAELLILAAALGVPPLSLLYPDLPDGPVEVIPGVPMSSFTAYMWATGMMPSIVTGDVSKADQLVDAVLRRRALMLELPGLQLRSSDADPQVRDPAELRLNTVQNDIRRLDAQIREAGGVINDA